MRRIIVHRIVDHRRLVGDLVERRSQRRRWVVSGHQHHHRAPAGPQPRHERRHGPPSSSPSRSRRRRQPTVAARRARASCSTTSARPWKHSASASSNGNSPLYGLIPATVDRASCTAALRRADRRGGGRRTPPATRHLPVGRRRVATPGPARRPTSSHLPWRSPWRSPRRVRPERRRRGRRGPAAPLDRSWATAARRR